MRDILTGLGLSEEGEPEAPVASAMRFLDKGDWEGLSNLFSSNSIDTSHVENLKTLSNLDGGIETIDAAKQILQTIGVSLDSLGELETLLTSLELLAPSPPSLKLNLCVARGLDYYTGMVFEVNVAELGGEGQVLGGGSYRLLHLFGMEDLDPSCGFGLGFDRVLLALEAQAARMGREEVVPGEKSSPSSLILPFNIPVDSVLRIVKELRNSGHAIQLDLRGKNIGKTLDWASKNGFTRVIIVGPKDLESGVCTIKNLQSGSQETAELNSDSISGFL